MDWIMDLNLERVFQICCLKRTLNAGLHMIGLTAGMDMCAAFSKIGWLV